MKLHELREALDTEARKRCEAQEKTIKNQNATIEQLMAILKDRNEDIRKLQGRCFLLTRGHLCLFCGMRHTCARKPRGEGI